MIPAGLAGLLLAVAIGFLVGVERGWRLRDEEPGGRVAGIRTFTLMGLLGGLAGLEAAGPLRLLTLVLAAGAVAALVVGYRADMDRDRDLSVTTTLAGVITLALGAIAASGQMAIASVGAGLTVLFLASREPLHQAVAATREVEIRALVRLALVAFVVLPILPDRAVGPYDAINPQRLWLVVVTIGAVSFFAYLLTRWLGPKKGVPLAAAAGALVSSTAVTIASARRLKEGASPAADRAAVAIASTLMVARTLLLVALLAPSALAAVAACLAPAFLVSAAGTFLLLARARAAQGEEESRDVRPPHLRLAFLFALLVAFLSLAAAAAQARFGHASGALVIALGGMVDVDSAVAAVATLPPGRIAESLAAMAIAGPVAFNSLLKAALLLGLAGWKAARAPAALLVAVSAAVLAALAVAALPLP